MGVVVGGGGGEERRRGRRREWSGKVVAATSWQWQSGALCVSPGQGECERQGGVCARRAGAPAQAKKSPSLRLSGTHSLSHQLFLHSKSNRTLRRICDKAAGRRSRELRAVVV